MEVGAEAKFCHHCGNPLDAASNESRKREARDTPSGIRQRASDALKPAGGTTAERRQLTVVFSDLVSFTKLSQRLDPEDLNTVVHEYYNVCKSVCKSYEGHVANYLGDGVLMFFGYPAAHEDDANRAVRTGLAIIEGVMALNHRNHNTGGIPLQVRVGIHTGLMIVGDDRAGDWQQMALGETLNIAARVQAVAQSDSLVVSPTTYKLIEGFFACRSLGLHTLKGVEQPMEVFEVSQETTARSRLEAAGRGGLTPLTGRESEVQTLLECWEENFQGKGGARWCSPARPASANLGWCRCSRNMWPMCRAHGSHHASSRRITVTRPSIFYRTCSIVSCSSLTATSSRVTGCKKWRACCGNTALIST